MVYTRNPTWKPGIAGGTIISALALNRLEDGLVGVAADVDANKVRIATAVSDIATLSSRIAALSTRIDNLPASTGSSGSTGTDFATVGIAVVA